MAYPRVEMIGLRFGRLLVQVLTEVRHGAAYYRCLCSCGNTTHTRGSTLRQGRSKSCGCLNRENVRRANRTHGHATTYGQTTEYQAWACMKRRCSLSTHKDYKNYGGRGITVCARWFGSFENFLADMGKKPEARLSLERRDNNGHYEPSNCYWATAKEQRRNQRPKQEWTA